MAKRKWIKPAKEDDGKAKPPPETKGRAHKLFGKKPMVRR